MEYEEVTKKIIGCAYRVIRAHEVQLVNYLVATRKPVGLVLNFGEENVEIKRKVRNLHS
jgi:hypothetical protein